MKSRVLFLLIILVSSANMSAQNLVPNGSFEEGSECPMFLDDLHFRCNDWYKSIQVPGVPMNENPSPDWYHACSELDELSTPNFVFGYQTPSDGEGISAIICFDNLTDEYREIAGIELLETMTIGQQYTVSFKTVAEIDAITTGVLVDKIGFKLTTYPYFDSIEDAINNEAHGFANDVIGDTINWTTLSFDIIADSAYEYLHIGSFFQNDQMTPDIVGTNSPRTAYYFFDEVEVIQSPLNSLEQYQDENAPKLYPNPATNAIRLVHKQHSRSVKFYRIISADGVLVDFGKIYDDIIDISSIPKGFYFFNFVTVDGENFTLKFLKQ